jgi:hypothetical protein
MGPGPLKLHEVLDVVHPDRQRSVGGSRCGNSASGHQAGKRHAPSRRHREDT